MRYSRALAIAASLIISQLAYACDGASNERFENDATQLRGKVNWVRGTHPNGKPLRYAVLVLSSPMNVASQTVDRATLSGN
jgi:hypothetical protein